MRRPRPSSWPRCCVVGSNWESLGEGVGHFGVGGAQPRARPGEGLGGGQERIRRSHLWVRPALASHPRPGGQRTPVVRKGPVSAARPVTRPARPILKRPLGLGLWRPRDRGIASPPFPDVSLLLSLKRHLRLLGVCWLPPHVLEAGFWDAKREVTSIIPYPF